MDLFDLIYILKVTEIQAITCLADGGFFYLTFRENTTLPMFANDSIQVLKQRLEQLYT